MLFFCFVCLFLFYYHPLQLITLDFLRRGNLPALLSVAPTTLGGLAALNEQFPSLSTFALVAEGVLIIPFLCAVYPLDVARIRMAVDTGPTPQTQEFRGLFDCLQKMYRAGGVKRGLFRGLGVHIMGQLSTAFVTLLATFVCFGVVGTPFALVVPFFVGGVSGGVYYAFDSIRGRLIMQIGNPKPIYNSFWDCLQKVKVNEGYVGLFRGLVPHMLAWMLIGPAVAFALQSRPVHKVWGQKQVVMATNRQEREELIAEED